MISESAGDGRLRENPSISCTLLFSYNYFFYHFPHFGHTSPLVHFVQPFVQLLVLPLQSWHWTRVVKHFSHIKSMVFPPLKYIDSWGRYKLPSIKQALKDEGYFFCYKINGRDYKTTLIIYWFKRCFDIV